MHVITARLSLYIKSFFLVACLYAVCQGPAQAQTAAPYNRFQYHNYKWKVLRTALFQLYFPPGYDSLASFASVQLPDIVRELKSATLIEVNAVPNLVIYPSVTHTRTLHFLCLSGQASS